MVEKPDENRSDYQMSHDLKKKTVFDVYGFILLSDDKILRGWKRAQKNVESLQNVRETLCCLL